VCWHEGALENFNFEKLIPMTVPSTKWLELGIGDEIIITGANADQ
jgi:hypothetical protein